MKFPSESSTNKVLEGLRSLSDPNTARAQGGCRVADIVPPQGPDAPSLPQRVSDKVGLSVETVKACIALLGRVGLVQPSAGRRIQKRWVALEGEFLYQNLYLR